MTDKPSTTMNWLDECEDDFIGIPPQIDPQVIIQQVTTTATVVTTVKEEVSTTVPVTTVNRFPRCVPLRSSTVATIVKKVVSFTPSAPVLPPASMATTAMRRESSTGSIMTTSGYGGKQQHQCIKCGSTTAFISLTAPHIESIKEHVSEGNLDKDVVGDDIKEGYYCNQCLSIISPRCRTCQVKPRNVLPPGSRFPFALFCKDCIRKHRFQS